MTYPSITNSVELYRRSGAVQRAFTLAPVVPSQDVTRYQARNMPTPTYDLAHEDGPTPRLTILLRTLALVAACAGIFVLRRFTTLLQS
jgi:hypothetical protein